MTGPLMPKATAIWLLDNTALTFQQIADFCHLHVLEVDALANADPMTITMGMDPISSGQLTMEEIEASAADPSRPLKLKESPIQKTSKKSSRYTPISRRSDKPSAILFLLKNYPDLSDLKIIRLIGTTKATIDGLRHKTHWNILNIKPTSPVILGMCTQEELDKALSAPLAKEKTEAKPKRTKTKNTSFTKTKDASKKDKDSPKKTPENPSA